MGQTVDIQIRARCDVCGSLQSKPAGSYLFDVPGHPLDGTRWNLRRCQACRLVYLETRPANQIFGGFVPFHETVVSPARLWTRRLRTIERFVPRGRLLDVGTGGGEFLEYASRSGWQVKGLDVQEEFARQASRKLGIDIHCGDIHDASIQEQVFDTVTMWDVIEHVPSPAADIQAAARSVLPGGMLALSTINSASLNARVFGGSWVFWNRPGRVPEHLQAFAPQTLRYALEEAGFTPVMLRTQFAAGALIEPAGRHLSVWLPAKGGLKRARRSLVGRAAAFAAWRSVALLGHPLVLLDLGDILEVYAVRRA